jgi:hypothetical protein
MKKQFRDFESARDFAQQLGLKNRGDWQAYCNSGNKPYDIPQDPSQFYKNDFKGIRNWLGNEYRPFKEAREFAISLNLKGQKEWQEYCKSGDMPDDIPANPNRTYKNKGWKTMGDWLGTGTVSSKNKLFRSLKNSRKFVRSLNLKSQTEWREYCASGKKPEDIPVNPDSIYKNKGWKNYSDWLGVQTIATFLREFRSFEESKKFLKTLNLKNVDEWRKYCASGNKPDDIPANPRRTYQNNGWNNWGEFLGTGTIASNEMEWRPFKEAKEFVRGLGLKQQKEWLDYCASGNKPDDIPSNPWSVYKEWNIKRRDEKK